MRSLLTTLAICALSIGLITPPAHANPDSADLTISISWAGNGAPKAQVGQTASYSATATNLGPDTAQQVQILFSLADQFAGGTADCGAGNPDCIFASLAAGHSITVSFDAVVCCLAKGQPGRDASVTASVQSATPDPNLANNLQRLPTLIIGGFGFFFPGSG